MSKIKFSIRDTLQLKDELISVQQKIIDDYDPYYKKSRKAGITNPESIPKMVKLLELIPHTERCNEGISDGCDYRCCYDEAQSILNELGITKGDSK